NKNKSSIPTVMELEVFGPALPHRSEGSIQPRLQPPRPRKKEQPAARGLHAPGQGHVFQDFGAHRLVTARSLINSPPHEHVLSVRGRRLRLWVVHLLKRVMFGEPHVDERDDGLLPPRGR